MSQPSTFGIFCKHYTKLAHESGPNRLITMVHSYKTVIYERNLTFNPTPFYMKYNPL